MNQTGRPGGRPVAIRIHSRPMSTLAIVLIVVGAILLIFFIGGFLAARRRANRPETLEHIRAADQALEQARASDRGWDRDLLTGAAGDAIRQQKPGFEWERLDLVLVEDRPGVAEDRAHLVAAGPGGSARVILARREGGEWYAEQVD